jgi:hypothetical protein
LIAKGQEGLRGLQGTEWIAKGLGVLLGATGDGINNKRSGLGYWGLHGAELIANRLERLLGLQGTELIANDLKGTAATGEGIDRKRSGRITENYRGRNL